MKTWLALLLALACVGCGSTPKSTSFTVHGTLLVTDSGGSGMQADAGGNCAGTGGYGDINTGTQVKVENASGKTVAIGALEAGTEISPGSCSFDFTVTDVPKEGNIYAVEVSHRGSINFTRAQAGSVDITLGD